MPLVKGRSKRATIATLLGLLPRGKIVDLGTGHGDWAMHAADLGWDVTAVDARTERWPSDDRIRWVEADVRTFDLAPYDAIMCLGLWYHLGVDDQLSLLERAHPRPIVLDTHLAVDGPSDHGPDLTERITARDRYVGRLYAEGNAAGSSWGNRWSFWPTVESFHRMMVDSGYRHVLQVQPWFTPDRTFFLALAD